MQESKIIGLSLIFLKLILNRSQNRNECNGDVSYRILNFRIPSYNPFRFVYFFLCINLLIISPTFKMVGFTYKCVVMAQNFFITFLFMSLEASFSCTLFYCCYSLACISNCFNCQKSQNQWILIGARWLPFMLSDFLQSPMSVQRNSSRVGAEPVNAYRQLGCAIKRQTVRTVPTRCHAVREQRLFYSRIQANNSRKLSTIDGVMLKWT